ncbi:MAG: DNA-binding protein [Halobacteriovorax sp.]|nr:DNA-binding protein [Halobacteriovorax sp.]|tara:strand:+ start:7575 stop:8084 length:510 start_codon:yes stop_codon:yes gene_type:complete
MITPKIIEKKIYIIRDTKVMLDSDLADLYGVETKYLNRQVKRNLERFPKEFMFQLSKIEFDSLKCQFGTSKKGRGGKQKLPFVFTEYGIAALSGVINSPIAIRCNIAIIKTFIEMRKVLKQDESLSQKLEKLEEGTNQMFKVVFERLDDLEAVAPLLPPRRTKIGFKKN